MVPSNPADAKGLLNTAINDPNPVLFFEHKGLYRSIRGDVPTDYYTLPFGKASLLREGNSISVVTYGAGVHWAMETLEKHPEIDVDLVDMEAYALAKVCKLENVKFRCFKYVSDRADENAPNDWTENCKKGAKLFQNKLKEFGL